MDLDFFFTGFFFFFSMAGLRMSLLPGAGRWTALRSLATAISGVRSALSILRSGTLIWVSRGYFVLVEAHLDVVDLAQVVVPRELEVVALEDGGEGPVHHFELLVLAAVDRHGPVGVLQPARVDCWLLRRGFLLRHADQVAEARPHLVQTSVRDFVLFEQNERLAGGPV